MKIIAFEYLKYSPLIYIVMKDVEYAMFPTFLKIFLGSNVCLTPISLHYFLLCIIWYKKHAALGCNTEHRLWQTDLIAFHMD